MAGRPCPAEVPGVELSAGGVPVPVLYGAGGTKTYQNQGGGVNNKKRVSNNKGRLTWAY
jgi:hypothetical protein